MIAHVFKVSIDPYVGKLGVLRVHQGTVRPGSQLFVGDARKPMKIAPPLHTPGQGHDGNHGRLIPGDICAIAKVDELHLDAVLHDSHDEDQYHLLAGGLSAADARARHRAGARAAMSSDSPIRCTNSPPRIRACASSTTRR